VLKQLWLEWLWLWEWGIKRRLQGKRPAIRGARRFQAEVMLKVITATEDELDTYAARLAALGYGSTEELRAALGIFRLESALYSDRREKIRRWLDGIDGSYC
jgi:hypothetical protein